MTRTPLCSGQNEIISEAGEEVAVEVKSKKRKIIDDKPVIYGLAILQWSKV